MAAPASPGPGPLQARTDNAWPPERRGTWFAIAAAPFAWGADIALGWWISGQACRRGAPRFAWFQGEAIRAVEAAVALACIALGALALWFAWRAWRGSGNRRVGDIQGRTRPDFLAAVAVLVSVSFLLGTVYGSLAQWLLPMCEAVR